nr:hypothetical protein [Tanacetum cinerariifolium]
MTDYSLWEVIFNDDFLAPTRVIEGVAQPVAPTTVEQRLARKNELKARGTLLMALPDKHQLKFNIHKDAKTLMEEIEKRFGENKDTKKVQKTLLKQQYENFTGSSSESLDQIHDRLQKLISQLEILKESLSQEDINLKFLRSLPSEWRTRTLIWRNKTDLKEQCLDDLFNSLKIYEAEVKSYSSASTFTQNIAFVSSQTTDNTNEPISAVASVFAASTNIPVATLPNVDTLSNGVIYSFFANQSNTPQLDNDDLKNLGENGPTSMVFDMLKVECYNCHRKGHFARECRSPKDTRRNVAAEPQRRNVLAEKEPTNYALMAFTSSSSSSSDNETDESLLASPIYDRHHSGDGYHVVPPPYTGTFMPPKPDLVFYDAPNVNETVHTAFNVELSFTKPDQDLSHIHRPSAPIIEDWVSNLKDDFEPEITQITPSFVQPIEQVNPPRPFVKHVKNSIPASIHKITIPKPKSHRNRRNRKACFVCKSLTYLIKDRDYYEKKVAQTPDRNNALRGNHQQYARMTVLNLQRHVVPTTVLTKSKLVPITAVRPVTAAIPKTHVTRPRPAKSVVPKPHSPPRRHINRSQSPKPSNFSLKVTAAKAHMVNAVKGNWGNPQHALKDKRVIDSGCSRHMTGNMSYLFDFEEFNGGYVAFGGNPKGGKISGKGKIRTGKLDFDDVYFVKELKFNLFSVSQMCDKKNNVLFTDTECLVLYHEFKLPNENEVLLRVPRENNMYNVDLKNNVPSGDLTCLFAKATLDESNLWHRRPGHINFKTMNKLGKQHRASCKTKPVSSVSQPLQRTPQQNGIAERKNMTLIKAARTMLADSFLPILFWAEAVNTACGPTWLFDIDTLTKTMNYQPVITGNQSNPSAGVQKQIDAEKAGEENVLQYVLFSLWSSGSTNPQNTDDDAAFRGKKPEFEGRKPESEVYVSPSSKLEDITYSDDEEDVGAEADFTNLETTITVSPIPNLRVYKDHHVTQIIGDLSSATQTRSMTRVAKDEGFEDPDYPDKWGKIDQTLFIKGKKGDILLVQIYVDDIIFGSTNKYLCKAFEKLMNDKFQMSSIDGKSASTLIDTEKLLLKDPDGEDVDVHTYRSMISSFMYFTSSRPDIMFVVCACASFQVTPKVSHLHVVKRIFRYLKGKTYWGLWYPKDSHFNLLAYSDSDYAGVNDVLRLQALVDKKKVMITEATIREALRLDDAESIDCLANEEIFIDLSRMGYEKPSTKLTFYNAFFSQQWNLVRNVDSPTQFYVYPRFLQLMIKAQVGDLSSHSIKYSSTALTQKVFANMRRVGKGFSGVDTPLFKGIIVAQQVNAVPTGADEGTASVAVDDVPAAVDEPSIPSPTPTTQPPPPSQDLPSTLQVLPTPPPSPIDQPPSPQQQPQLSQPSHDAESLMDLLHTLLETCTTLTRRVEHLEQDKIAQTLEITKGIIADMDADEDVTLKDVAAVAEDVEKIEDNSDVHGRQAESQAQIYQIDLEHADKVLSIQDDKVEPAKLKEVVEVVTTAKLMTKVVTTASATITVATTPITATTLTTAHSAARRRKGVVIRDPEETAASSIIIHTEPKSKDKGKGIMVQEPKPLKKKTQIEQDEAYAREYFNSNMAFLEKTKEQLEEEEEESRALKRKTESKAEKEAKKQKLDEEVEELRKHLQIVPNDEDDVYTKATPLARKVPVVDYEIYTENNKPYYKIIKADGSPQLFLSFLSLLRNFDREDLEVLWQMVKERFAYSKPKNFSDDFLLTILTYMFEKPNVETQVWKNQRSVHGLAKVKSWRLLESCGVHIITFTTTQMVLLVERRYPLTRFTLDQLLNNVRLEVKEESEVSLELLRFVRQQQQERFRPEKCLDTPFKIKSKIKLVEQRRKLMFN